MKIIIKIAGTELRKLFCSPAAWLILIVFTFQFSVLFNDEMTGLVENVNFKSSYLHHITWNFFAHIGYPEGVYYKVLGYLYLYIPLLTMNSMSREYSTGSIKLLYSAPVTNRQIIFGKYLALMIFGLILIAILSVFAIYAGCVIEQPEIPLLLTHLFGIYLLICAYCAIGLFVSSLTSYPVVAALGTLALLALLNKVGGIGQGIAFVRDLTYWLSLSGRGERFIQGLITSEAVLYFLMVIGLFLSFAIIKLQSGRQHTPKRIIIGQYTAVLMIAALVGYFSSRPGLTMYVDVTRCQTNTLSKSSQEVMKKLKDKDVTITTYTNVLGKSFRIALPDEYKNDVKRFEQYLQFKPDLKLNYVYYYRKTDNPWLDKRFPGISEEKMVDTLKEIYDLNFDIISYKDIAGKVDLSGEDYQFVREIVQKDGNRTFLRIYDDLHRLPFESQITSAFKRLSDDLPTVGFLTGHEERSSNSDQDGGYKKFAQEKTFRSALINNGFLFEDLTLAQPIPPKIKILVIADMKKSLTEQEQLHLQQYIQQGGNLLIAGEPGRQAFMNPVTASLGIQFMEGQLASPSPTYKANMLMLPPLPEVYKLTHHFDKADGTGYTDIRLPMNSTTALAITQDKGYRVTTLFQSDSTSWNEIETTNFEDDSATLGPKELRGTYPTVLALNKQVNNKNQKILVTGDADWLSNKELGMERKGIDAANSRLIQAAFFWLSDGEAPPDMRRAPSKDNVVNVSQQGWAISNIFLKWVFTGGLALIALLVWIKRRGR